MTPCTHPGIDHLPRDCQYPGGCTGCRCETCEATAVNWLTADLPTMRATVRAEHPDWTGPQVAIEAIRRLG